MYTEIERCRICNNSNLISIMDLGEQTLSGVFPKSADEIIAAGPVELVKCKGETSCGLVQLKQSYSLDDMYGENYGYRSGLNAQMVSHLQSKVQKILDMDVLKPGDIVVDIGSNDATTLRSYPQDQYNLIGIDPTGKKFASYYPDTITLVPDFFSAAAIQSVLGDQRATVITSFAMFYDLEDPVQFAREVNASLADNGIWVFEQSYLPAMLEASAFDTICHEHLEFYALKQIEWITKAAGLKILDVENNDVNGGSFSIIACKSTSTQVAKESHLQSIRDREISLHLDDDKIYESFRDHVSKAKNDLLSFLDQARSEGKSVYGLGASTKGNVLLQYFDITSKLIAGIAEVNDEKFGSFTPGTLIPISPQDEVLARNPDYLLVLPWHFREFFLSHPNFKGKQLVFPFPKFEIVDT